MNTDNAPQFPAELPRRHITGLVLCGGQGRRMGGVDKGLQPLHGQPLALHALQRLGPQVGTLAINANRSLQIYREWAVPVWPDSATAAPDDTHRPAFEGPLAGLLAGLSACSTPWLATVPCDSPSFPLDLVPRLAWAAHAARAPGAMAATHTGHGLQLQPVFALLQRSLQPALAGAMASGVRKAEAWMTQQGFAVVEFPHAPAFFNVNTPQDLLSLQRTELP